MKGAIPILVVFMLASMLGFVQANEVHKNGFGGITPLNTTGLTIFSDDFKRSFDYESDNLVLSADFSILETSGDIRDFSLFDNDLSLSGDPTFVNSDFITALATDGSSQWASVLSDTLDLDNYDNASMVWWGQTRQTGNQSIAGVGCTGGSTSYLWGLYLNPNNNVSAKITNTCTPDTWVETDYTLQENVTYGIGVVWENINQTEATDVHFWVNGDWIFNITVTGEYIFDIGTPVFYVGKGHQTGARYCNCTHDELLVFKGRLDNSTMQLLTTKEHSVVIKSGPLATPQGFGGLFFALPWVIVFGLLGWVFYAIVVSLKDTLTR